MTEPTTPTVPKFVFDKPAHPDGEAFELFRQSSLPHFAISVASPEDKARFAVNAVTYPLPHMILTRVRGGAMIMRRGAAEIAADPNPPVLNIHVQLAGDSDGTAGDKPLSTRPGDVLFYDYARPLECTNTPFECITLLFARNRAHPAFLHPDAHGAKLAAGSGAARLVASVAEAVHAQFDQLSLPEADLALQSLVDLAGRMLDHGLAAPGTPRATVPLIAAALAFIDLNLDDETLSSVRVREHLELSRSSLYRLFEPLGGVENAIRQRRLDRSMRAILTDADDEVHSVSAGFNNEEQFARAFQARFGARPSRYREVVRSQDTEWLSDQSKRMGYVSLEAWIADLEGRNTRA